MKRAIVIAVFLLTIGTCFPAASQVEFVATVKTVTVETEAATLTMQLTPTFTLDVLVTSLTEIRGEGDAELAVGDLAAGMILKIEGVFVEGGILAKEVQVFAGVADFEIKGAIQSVDEGAKKIVIANITVQITDETNIRDCEHNELTIADLEAGQIAKVEGSLGEALVAESIVACSAAFKAPRIAFEGVITEVTETGIVVQVEGVDNVPVKITEDTDVNGELVVGAKVRVNGVIEEDLSVTATKVTVMQALQLAPGKLEHLKVGQSHPVVIILHALYESDVTLAVVSLDPDIADVSAAEVVIPAGKLTGAFRVIAKAVGETTVEVSLPAELGGAKATLAVEVTQSQLGQQEVRWVPPALSLRKGQERTVSLILRMPVADPLDVALSQVSGDPIVEFPATVTVKAGTRYAPVTFKAGQIAGTVKIRATLPDSAGGGTADLVIGVRDK